MGVRIPPGALKNKNPMFAVLGLSRNPPSTGMVHRDLTALFSFYAIILCMAFNENAQTLTVIGQWQDPSGEPARGYIEVQLTQPTADKNINVIYIQKKMKYELDGNGAVEIELIKTGSAPGDAVPLSRSVGLTITEVFADTKRTKWSTVIDTTNNDVTDVFNLADAAPIEAKAMNQYVLLGAYSADLFMKADKENPTFTGTVTGVSKAHVGLGNVDNTSDADKPVSTAQQTALNLKANNASPNLTGTVDLAGANISTDTTTGTKIGTAASQKFGFFNATPISQPVAATDLGTALSSLGLRNTGSTYALSTTGVVQFNGPFRRGTAAVSGATALNLTSSASVIFCSNGTTEYSITLPSTTTSGYEFVFKRTDNGANPINIVTAAAGSIDGTATTTSTGVALTTQWQLLRVISTGTANVWYIVT